MEDDAVELITFSTQGDAYVYAPLPPATSYGHRAELWNPDKWLQEVKIKVVTAGDHCFVRMMTNDTGELFAECPLPADGTALTTAVESVVDSSRYFVIKVVDRESRNHAFVGIGFRDRMEASDFTAALDDYRQYLRRRQEAEQLRQEFGALQAGGGGSTAAADAGEQQQQQLGVDGVGSESSPSGPKDFSLKPGETIHIKLSPSLKRGDSGKVAGGAASILRSSSGGGSSAVPSAVPRLAPPVSSSSSSSSSGFFRLHLPPAASSGAVAGASGAAAGAAQQQQHYQQQHTQHEPQQGAQGAAVGPPAAVQNSTAAPGRPSLSEVDPAAGNKSAAAAAAVNPPVATAAVVAEDDWGEFVG